MPPKRRTPAKAATPAAKAAPPAPAPPPPKPISSTKPAPAPAPAPAPIPPPPPPPIGSLSSKVRKEWVRFCDGWYKPQQKKRMDKLEKDLLVKYKNLGTAQVTQKLREMELYESLDWIAEQLSQPARAEWERRLEVAQLREDQWDDMTGEEQQAVLSVFVGFFGEDVEDIEDDDDVSGEPSSIEEEENVVEEPQHRGHPSYPLPATSRLPIPPSPTRGNFEFVNPTAFFADTLTPPHPTKKLPALTMDNLATLGPSVGGRSADFASAGVGGTFSFQNWASEAGIITQQPQVQPAKPPISSASAAVSQTLGARPRATDNMSRQASAASTFPSPPLKTYSPQYSPPNQTTKFSPPTNADTQPLGKRYIGPVIIEAESDPMDEGLLRSKMAADYQEYKISLRIQMIYQFHAEAAQIEIKLVEMLTMADEGTKESRARAVQEHETNMMRLREQKEEERKRLCAEEREKRREELRSHVAQLRSAQNLDVDPRAKQNPPKPWLDKSSAQPRAGHGTHQKENVPLPPPVSASSSRPEAPSIKKSISTLSQDDVSANEALFAKAMAMMHQGNIGSAVLNPAQASSNEALFADAAAMLSAQRQPGSNGKNTLQPPSILKKSNSSRSQENDVPHITVSFAEAPPSPSPSPVPEPVQPPPIIKAKKGKKGQPVSQPLPVKPVTITKESEIDAEPPPVPSLWGTAANAAKSGWGAASASIPTSNANQNFSVTEELVSDSPSMTAQAPSWGNVSTKNTAPASKKGRKVTITEEPDAEADPIVSPPPPFPKPATATKGGWGPVNGKSKATPPVTGDSEPDLPLPTPPVPSARGKKAAQTISKSSSKPQLKVTVSEEQESEFEPAPAPTSTKTAWGGPIAATPRAGVSGKQAGRKAATPQPESRRGAAISSSKYVRVDPVPEPEDEWSEPGGSGMPGGLQFGDAEQEEAVVDEEEEEADASDWFKPENLNYWANFMAGQSEEKTQVPPEVPAESGKHAVWTPTVGNDSDDDGDMEGVDDELAGSMWFEYAINGNDLPSLGVPDKPQAVPSGNAQHGTSLWEQGKGKKKSTQVDGDTVNRAQQTSVFDRAAFSGGQWPKMESWLSPASRVGQSSGSTRVF